MQVKRSKKLLKLAVTMLIVMAMLMSSAAMAFGAGFSAGSTATVKVRTSLNFRSGPGTNQKIIARLKNGTKVTIISRTNNWYKVKLSSGKVGYVHSSYLTAASSSSSTSSTTTSTKPAAPTPTPAPSLGKLEKDIVLATTTSTQDTGLLDVLVPAFEKKYNVSVKTVAVGTGEAIAMGKRGDADVLLVHARSQEDAFVSDGYGVNRKDVMYNFFYLVGPKGDPAGIASASNAVEAFKKIASSGATFVSRGDKSGTNTKELSIWSQAGIKPNPATDSWYMESGQGMGATLTMANELGAYTLVDSGTWYAYETKLDMKIIYQGDPALFNPYGVIAVNPKKFPNIHYNTAMAFVNFITSAEGQKIIGDYKKNGHQLFVPSAK